MNQSKKLELTEGASWPGQRPEPRTKPLSFVDRGVYEY